MRPCYQILGHSEIHFKKEEEKTTTMPEDITGLQI